MMGTSEREKRSCKSFKNVGAATLLPYRTSLDREFSLLATVKKKKKRERERGLEREEERRRKRDN